MNRLLKILLSIAQENALKFPTLNQFLDWDKIQKFLIENISRKTQKNNIPFNLLEALLIVEKKNFPAVYDTNSNLLNIEASLKKLFPILSESDKLEIKIKLSNLGNTSFWDTATELWFASELKKNNCNIKFDFPIRDSKKGLTPPNVDVAIVDDKNEPIWLFDCISPTLGLDECKELKLERGNFIEESEKAIECSVAIIKNKFEKKFLPNINYYPKASYGIFVTLTKADDIAAHLSTLNLLKKTPVQINSTKYQLHPKLKYAVVGRFQESSEQIEFVDLILYKVV